MQRLELEEAQVVQHIVTSLLFRLGCFKFSGGNILFYITLVFGSPESFYAKFLVQTTAFIHKKKKILKLVKLVFGHCGECRSAEKQLKKK